jgi:hypothetical protein
MLVCGGGMFAQQRRLSAADRNLSTDGIDYGSLNLEIIQSLS